MDYPTEVCGYCGQQRGEEDTICPNTGAAFHTWDSEPWKTEAICERKHLQDYPTEQQAQERELARILWQITVDGNAERAQRLQQETGRDPYAGLDELRAKLTSWPAMLCKRYEVVKALALGWWYQFRLDLVAVAIAILLVAVCGWLSVR